MAERAIAPGASGGASGSAAKDEKRPAMFSLLRMRSYRSYWISNFFYFTVFGAQRFAFVLLILELTGRAGLGGVIGFMLGVPAFFISIPAGVWADRFDRRKMVMVSNGFGAAVVLTVAALAWTDTITPWMALVLALAAGFTTASVQPPLASIVPMIVPPERLMNGIVLRTMGQNLAQVLGAAVGGIAIATAGFGGAFALQGLLYAVGFVTIAMVRLERPAPVQRRPSMREAATEGLRFVFLENPALRSLAIISIFSGVFMLGPIFVLVPEIARTKLGVSAGPNGLLMAFTGMGMFLMSLFLAWKGNIDRKGFWFVTNMLIAGPMLIVMGWSGWYALTALAMFSWGLGGGIFINLNQTLIQGNTPNQMMGRVMSIYSLSIAGLVPLGSLLGGVGAEFIGADRYMMLSGTVLLGCAVWAWLTQRELRALD